MPLPPRTSAFGEAFEYLVVTECHRLNEILERDFRRSYLRTKDGLEVDLILQKPSALYFVEINSSERVDPLRVARFARALETVPEARGYWLSRDPAPQDLGGVACREWREGLGEIFGA